MKLRICFISKNENLQKDLQFESVILSFNNSIEFELITVDSIIGYQFEKDQQVFNGVFLDVNSFTIHSKEWLDTCEYLNSLNKIIVFVFTTKQNLYVLNSIPISLWRFVKTYFDEKEIFFEVFSAVHSIIEFSKIEHDKRYFQEILKVTSHMFTLINEKSEFVYSSPTMKHLHGYDEGELKGKSFIKYIHPDDLYVVLAEFQKVKTSQNYNPTVEFRVLTKNGEYIRLECNVNNQLHNPILQAIVINSKDVTKLKHIESTLKYQEERIAKVYSLTSLGIWDWNLLNNTVYISPQLFSLLGVSYRDKLFSFEEFLHFYHPDDRQSFRKCIEDCFQQSAQFYHEHRVQHETSDSIWVLDRGAVVERNENNEPIRIVGTTTNITSRKIAEIQLQETNDKLNKLANSIPGMIYQFIRHTDGSMTCPYVSKGIQELYEVTIYTPGIALDFFLSRTHPDDVEAVVETIQKSATTLGIWELEYRLVLPKKGIRWVHGRSRPEELADGSILWHGYIHDITESKRISEHMLRNQRMESIGTLAGGIAHDLNNVLTPILLSIELLKSQIKEPQLLKRLEQIEASTLRGAMMVKQVLHFSRGIEGVYSAIDATELLDEISVMIKSSFPKNILFTTSLEDNLPYIYGDMTQMHQVLLNLCVNARDAMPNGGSLELVVKKFVINDENEFKHLGLDKGIYITIIVNDSGTGMNPEVKSRIFEPFYTTKDIGSGTGLGLSTVLNIIKSHNGYIDVYSEIGKGSSFRMYLPTTSKENEDEELHNLKDFSISHYGVLIVDDEDIIRDFSRFVLESVGFTVYEAENGAEAITILSKEMHSISLIIVDSMMPIMDGKTTITIAKKLNPDLKIIAVSGITQKLDQTEEFSNVLFLQKPYSSKQLLAAIHSLL